MPQLVVRELAIAAGEFREVGAAGLDGVDPPQQRVNPPAQVPQYVLGQVSSLVAVCAPSRN